MTQRDSRQEVTGDLAGVGFIEVSEHVFLLTSNKRGMAAEGVGIYHGGGKTSSAVCWGHAVGASGEVVRRR